jgi:hypothetical protein
MIDPALLLESASTPCSLSRCCQVGGEGYLFICSLPPLGQGTFQAFGVASVEVASAEVLQRRSALSMQQDVRRVSRAMAIFTVL